MARLRFSAKFRARLSEKLMELGNLTIVVLALGQFSERINFSLAHFIVGIAVALLCYFVAYLVSR